jgi:hypothetical protein
MLGILHLLSGIIGLLSGIIGLLSGIIGLLSGIIGLLSGIIGLLSSIISLSLGEFGLLPQLVVAAEQVFEQPLVFDWIIRDSQRDTHGTIYSRASM